MCENISHVGTFVIIELETGREVDLWGLLVGYSSLIGVFQTIRPWSKEVDGVPEDGTSGTCMHPYTHIHKYIQINILTQTHFENKFDV